LPAHEQQRVRAAAAAAGYEEIGVADAWIERARSSRWVVTTPSSVVVDLLAQGVLPILLVPDWLDPDCALAQYPLAVEEKDIRAMEQATMVLADPARRAAVLAQALERIEPAANCGLGNLLGRAA
jgi:hypothetical protein